MPDSLFPNPVATIGGKDFYTKVSIRGYMAEAAGLPAPEPREDDDHWLKTAQVRAMLGGVSAMWIWRRRHERKAAGTAPESTPPAAA